MINHDPNTHMWSWKLSATDNPYFSLNWQTTVYWFNQYDIYRQTRIYQSDQYYVICIEIRASTYMLGQVFCDPSSLLEFCDQILCLNLEV